MSKLKKYTCLEHAAVAFMVAVCCTHPATAGNKGQVAPNGFGKVEASISYGTPIREAKQPLPNGVLSTTSVDRPAAGAFAVTPAGFPTAGNVTAVGLPLGTPSTVFCTVTSPFLPGGYKAVMRANVIGGAIADNDELELKIPITAAACASYDAEGVIEQFSATTGELRLSGNGSAGTAVWLRALLYTGLAVGDPSRADLITNSKLKGELVVAGPFSYTNCPAKVPISGDMTKIYLLVDSVAKSEPYTLTCQNPVSLGCSGVSAYPAPTLTGGCETDAEAIVRYSIAAQDLPFGVPTQVTATAKALLGDGNVDENSVLATCTFTATRNALVFDGFYSPLNYQTPQGAAACSHTFRPNQLIQKGQNVPIKFKTLCGGISVGGIPPTFEIRGCPSSNPSFFLEGTFEFVANEWHGQFNTALLGVVPGPYVIKVILQDGTSKEIAVKLK